MNRSPIGHAKITVPWSRPVPADEDNGEGEYGIVAPKAKLCIQSRGPATFVLPKVTLQEIMES